MAWRGRRGGASAQEDEPRREERAEQQAPAPQGPVLPPPPPVDYGVFMQGLVQAMQTQAHTQAALQAQLEAQMVLMNGVVTSRAFLIHADHVCNGCDGRCEASVVWFGCVVDQVWCRVAVAIGGRGVDANLRILQVQETGWRIVGRVALLNHARKHRGVVQFPWELAEGSV
ncbi:hypothetical protein Taro_056046 [Colocasia esculenta]|uniref:Uncharacterized protein n=1 Tax=Colocasia esculenta TaxID=4460 RepID=A0A843XW40_COLES|nr:hypothetical protein [Colocasia esculenta]